MEVLTSVRPFLYLSRILGAAPYTLEPRVLQKSSFLNRYSEILIGVDSVLVFLFAVNNTYHHSSTFLKALMSCTHWMTIGAHIASLFYIVRRYRDVLRVNMTKLNEFRVLGTRVQQKSLRSLRRGCLTLAVGPVVHCVLFMSLHYQTAAKRKFFVLPALRELCYFAMYFAVMLTYVWCFMFVVYVHVTRLCFRVIQSKLADSGLGRKRVWSLLGAHNMLADIADDANAIFSFYFLVITVLVFLEGLYTFTVYTPLYVGWISFVFTVLWLSYYGIQFFAVVIAAVQISSQAEKTANYLHELFIDNDDPELKEEIEIFSLQLLHRKVEFNACGFFKLDFSLLYSMVGAVTTYIIILMQFQGNNTVAGGNCTALNCSNCSTFIS